MRQLGERARAEAPVVLLANLGEMDLQTDLLTLRVGPFPVGNRVRDAVRLNLIRGAGAGARECGER